MEMSNSKRTYFKNKIDLHATEIAGDSKVRDRQTLENKRLSLDLLIEEAQKVQNQHLKLTGSHLHDEYDVTIIGSGPGGATLAYGLIDSGLRVLLLERGDFVPLEDDNWNEKAVLQNAKYVNSDEIEDSQGMMFQPFDFYCVGGMTKMYGACLQRFREKDFEEIRHYNGVSPAWPLKYKDYEPYYTKAERIYMVHGRTGLDPIEPWRSQPYPYSPVPKVDELEELSERLKSVGLNPYPLPEGLDLRSGGRCVYCGYCDGFPCRVLAKGDADLACIRPAITSGNVNMITRAYVHRLNTDTSGKKVISADVERDGQKFTVKSSIFVVAGGAINSPALLLRSSSPQHPKGLANSSGLVGANYMCHETSWVMFSDPEGRDMPSNHFWKSLGVNDWYFDGGDDWPYPLGTFQLAGNQHAHMYKYVAETYGLEEARRRIGKKMMPFFVISEDLPDSENRVSLEDGKIRLSYQANNVASHAKLSERVAKKLHEAGYHDVTIESTVGVYNGGGHHQCGTAVYGTDPKHSVLDVNCRTHDVGNLYVVDSCFFPSSTATNPVLTIAANALRVADHLKTEFKHLVQASSKSHGGLNA